MKYRWNSDTETRQNIDIKRKPIANLKLIRGNTQKTGVGEQPTYSLGYQTLHGLVSGLSEKEAHDALNIAVSRDKAHEEAVTLGLLCVILSEPQHATKSFRDLTLVTRDGLQLVMMCLSQLAVEKWLRMADVARSQLLWLLRELIRTGAAGVDNVCYNLMRHAAGGDVSPRNIALVDYMLDTFIENRTWLEKHPVLLSSMVYNYLRLIEDHSAPQFTMLRQKETSFVVGLLRDRFSDCMVIGRDLVRLLQNVARIPEIELLWRDILNNPKSLCPSFTGNDSTHSNDSSTDSHRQGRRGMPTSSSIYISEVPPTNVMNASKI
ncbi:Integrator complex subunit 3 [Homalodisca vitripennis]|nr:Integrator complex subunit 3 [Homalodisca vitripennis]